MLRFMLFVICLGIVMPVWSTDSAWMDVENRIEYAYYTEDARALEGLVTALDSGSPQDHWRLYYAGLANYRAALLYGAVDKNRAASALETCIDRVAKAIEQKKDFPDALALQSVCLSLLTAMRPMRAPLAAPRSTAQIERAIKLAPRNPRVLLLDALGDYDRPAIFGGSKERVLPKLQKAVEAFERERRDAGVLPGWGAADAYAFLARSYLDRGDAVAAREALERALLIAPEFALARRMISKITSG